jgi:Ran-binding protein 1
VFGAGFNSGGGFAAFSGAQAETTKAEDGGEGEDEHAEEECKAEFTPLVQLEEVEKTTGEENEDCLLELYAALPYERQP